MSERRDKRDIVVVLRDLGYIGQQAIFAEAADEIERLRGFLSAAGISLVTASILLKHFGHEADGEQMGKMADQVADALARPEPDK